MPLQTKGLWAEKIVNQASLNRVTQRLQDTGANLLCIRTDSPYIGQLIPQLHGQGIKVYGWRWPHARSATADPNQDPSFAPNEMNTVINLVGKGLDGYVFDIESEDDGAPNDWDSKGPANRAQVATAMVAGIVNAFKTRNTPYTLGLTSHQWGFSNYPHIPWQVFLDECAVLFPQTYWRADDGSPGVKKCDAVSYDYAGHKMVGTPDQALYNGFTDYAGKKNKAGNVLPIIPVAGEIGCAKAGEMQHFGALVAQRGLQEAHFYVDVDKPGYDPANPQNGDLRVVAEIKVL